MMKARQFKYRLRDEIRSRSGQYWLLFFALLYSVSTCQARQQNSAVGGWNFNSKVLTPNKIAGKAKSNTGVTTPVLSESVTGTGSDADSDESEKAVIEEQTRDGSLEEATLLEEDIELVPVAEESVKQILQEQEPIETSSSYVPEPVADPDSQLSGDLEAQYQRMRRRLETEDAFSEALGEEYLSYGLLLKRAGRLDEAREMLNNALHIVKINNGVYSIEQRPILRALFETNYLEKKTDETEANLKRILWLEGKNLDERDDYAFDLLLKMGNYYIDQFLLRSGGGSVSLNYLTKANQYLMYAVERYSDAALTQRMLPYGEIALANFLQSKVEVKLNARSTYDRSRQPGNIADYQQLKTDGFVEQSFSKGEEYLKRHLQKATAEQNQEQIVEALLGLGDVNLLFFRKYAAAQYYELAWVEAQKLSAEHRLVQGFNRPVELPAFKYALKRMPVERKGINVNVPLTFNVGKAGKVSNIGKMSEDDKLYAKARRAAKRLTFRPVIERGKMVVTEQLVHNVRVSVKRKNPS